MKGEKGFTLVELLVAMVAGGLLLASLSWAVATMAHELRGSRIDTKVAQLQALSPVLTRLVEGAYPPGDDGSKFTASPTGLIALVSPPEVAGPIGPLRLTLDVRQTAAGKSLEALFAPVDPTEAWPPLLRKAQPLAKGWDDIRFEFRALPQTDRPRLPALISIVFIDGDIERRIAIAPRLTTDGSCRFDPISMECRR